MLHSCGVCSTTDTAAVVCCSGVAARGGRRQRLRRTVLSAPPAWCRMPPRRRRYEILFRYAAMHHSFAFLRSRGPAAAQITDVHVQASKAASAKAKLGSTAGDKSGKSPAVSRDQVLRRCNGSSPSSMCVNEGLCVVGSLAFSHHAGSDPAMSLVQSSASLAELQNGIGKMEMSPTENGASADSAHGRTVTG